MILLSCIKVCHNLSCLCHINRTDLCVLLGVHSQDQSDGEGAQDDLNGIEEEEREGTLTCETEFDFKAFINE